MRKNPVAFVAAVFTLPLLGSGCFNPSCTLATASSAGFIQDEIARLQEPRDLDGIKTTFCTETRTQPGYATLASELSRLGDTLGSFDAFIKGKHLELNLGSNGTEVQSAAGPGAIFEVGPNQDRIRRALAPRAAIYALHDKVKEVATGMGELCRQASLPDADLSQVRMRQKLLRNQMGALFQALDKPEAASAGAHACGGNRLTRQDFASIRTAANNRQNAPERPNESPAPAPAPTPGSRQAQ